MVKIVEIEKEMEDLFFHYRLSYAESSSNDDNRDCMEDSEGRAGFAH